MRGSSERTIERIEVTIPLDPFLALRALGHYGGLSVRTLRGYLDHPVHPLPCYRVGGKILVRRSEFDAWISYFRTIGRPDLDRAVTEILRDL